VLNESAGEAATTFTLLISEKGGIERRQAFSGAEATIGRVAGNDLVLPKGNVSKRHARILFREGRLIVTDLNSTNGTFVNRRRITQATILREEDRLFIGDYVLRVEGLGQPQSDSVPADTTDRFSAPPLPGQRPISSSEPDSPLASALIGSDRPTSEDLGRALGGTSSLRSLDSSEQSRPSQRASEGAVLRTSAVQKVIEGVIRALGEPPAVVSEETASKFSETIVSAVDHLLVEGEVPVGVAADAVIDQVREELLDLGPIRSFLNDPTATVLAGLRYDDLVEVRDGKSQGVTRAFSSKASLLRAFERLIAAEGGESQDFSNHFEETFASGLSLSIGHSEGEGALMFVLRKPSKEPQTLDELVKRGVLSRAMATFLQLCLGARLNILLTSPPEEGSSMLLEALLGGLTRERALMIGQPTFLPDAWPSLSVIGKTGREPLGDLLPVALGVPGSRPVLAYPSPARLAEFFELSPASQGTLVALTAPGVRAALRSLPAAMALARPGLPLDVADAWVRGAFDVAVELGRHRDGRVRVLRIAEWAGERELSDVFSFVTVRGNNHGVEGSFSAAGELPRLTERLQAAGVRLDPALFQRNSSGSRESEPKLPR
jgi:pilus assembly protein CpaF